MIWGLILGLVRTKGDAGTQTGLIAYDCTLCTADTMNITSFSLIDVEACKYEWGNITTEKTHIQVVQTKRIFDVKVHIPMQGDFPKRLLSLRQRQYSITDKML